MRRWAMALVVILGLLFGPLANPAFGEVDLDDPDGDFIKTGDGTGDVDPCDECEDPCPPECVDFDTFGLIGGGVPTTPVPPIPFDPGTRTSLGKWLQKAVPQQGNEGLGELDGALIGDNKLRFWINGPGETAEHVDCLGFSENAIAIGGIEIQIKAPDKVAQIFKFVENPLGGNIVRLTLTDTMDGTSTFTVATTGFMNVGQLNDLIEGAVSPQFDITDHGDYWIIGRRHVTGATPTNVQLQTTDPSLTEMHIELRPRVFPPNYSNDCGSISGMGS